MSNQTVIPRSSAGHQETAPAQQGQGPSIGELAVGIFATAIAPVLEPFNHGGDLAAKATAVAEAIVESLSGNDESSLRAIRQAVGTNFAGLSPDEIGQAAAAAFDAATHRA